MLNSLYGRFGLAPSGNETSLMTNEELKKILKTNEVYSIQEVVEGVSMVNYQREPSINICNETGVDYVEEVLKTDSGYKPFTSVPIASAITAYSRILMNDFKRFVYYTDTDSAFVDIITFFTKDCF